MARSGGSGRASAGTRRCTPEPELTLCGCRGQAAVDTYGATDFLRMFFHPTNEAPNHNGHQSAESRLVGGPIRQFPERAAIANPMTYVTPDDPPILVMHGAKDILIPFHQSELLVEALRV